MRILIITGNHRRHLYFVNTINNLFPLAGVIMQKREEMIPQPPKRISEIDKNNFIKHFANRDIAERKKFGNQKLPNCPTHMVSKETLSDEKSVKFVRSIKPDAVLIFGANIIKDPLFGALPDYKINLHLGLSPWYKGDATLFWPFYFMEPNCAGSTFHIISEKVDAGDIIHQALPKLSKGDKIHDVACKVVQQSAKDAVVLLKYLKKHKSLPTTSQKATGKNFLNKDFKPEHLRVIYNLFDDDMVDHYLNNKLTTRNLSLIKFKGLDKR